MKIYADGCILRLITSTDSAVYVMYAWLKV